jgi:hypothetical protein
VAGWLEERIGVVPMTLLSWLRVVGDVWLVGTHPQWPESGLAAASNAIAATAPGSALSAAR